MSETIKLYNDDYSAVLLETDDRAAAHQFFRASGQESMPLVIDFGNGWTQRWGGKLVLKENACISYIGGSEFLDYMIHWPNPDLGQQTMSGSEQGVDRPAAGVCGYRRKGMR